MYDTNTIFRPDSLRSPACAALLVISGCLTVCGQPQAQGLRVDGERLNATMYKMKTFGGTPTGGSRRVAFSNENRDALEYLVELMEGAGLMARIDVAGNLIGTLRGSEDRLTPIVTGSHIDTVPDGGHYDGVVGVMAAIEVAHTLRDAGRILRHPLQIIVWSNEEGGKTGSRSLTGSVEEREFVLPSLGDRTIGEGIRFLGGSPKRMAENIRRRGDIAAYIELHVEQGAILDAEDVAIGVVDGIVGIKRWNVSVFGNANHAGTTPMDQRHDAMLAAARFTVAVNEIVNSEDGTQVATVGRIEAFPGVPNVIPGKVTMSLEIRDLDMQTIDRLFDAMKALADTIGETTGTTFSYDNFYTSSAAGADAQISAIIEQSATALELTAMHLPSGAGHDAQSLAPIAPVGMIFIPSRDGISHAPDEFTEPQEITNGANVLLQTLIRIDQLE
jgi:N-carbamoyl-L-amino-acid hydrolase